ncbi:hypothetical protein LDENG_00191660 [Lucifuga dentata]|nr:hypothetical protein LDENG_00191660 [Lucifuga dentata]
MPAHEGGQRLIDIWSRVMTFRLQVAQRLYTRGRSWLDAARFLLRRAAGLEYNRYLFLPRRPHQEAWQVFTVHRNGNERPGLWLFEDPFFFSDFIKSNCVSSPSLRSHLREAGCIKLGHLLKTPAVRLGEEAGVHPLGCSEVAGGGL